MALPFDNAGGASGGAAADDPAARRVALAHADNRLLGALALSCGARSALPDRPLYLMRGECLWDADSPLTHVYFPVRGVVSLGYTGENGESAHLAFVGREGVVGVEAFLGAERTSYRALVQLSGAAYRVRLSTLRSVLGEGQAFQPVFLGYALELMRGISRSSVCNLRHSVEQRLCRSLLQTVDRLASNTLPLTQDEVASLVGARRQGVSEAVQKLRDLGLIAGGRGSFTVVDRAGLMERACECYELLKGQAERLPRLAGPDPLRPARRALGDGA